MSEYVFLIKNTSHGQFHLMDDESYPDPSDVWTEEALTNRVAVTDGFVGISVLQDMPEVEVTLVTGETCPAEVLAAWDHAVECSLRVASGRLLVSPCIPMSDDEVFQVELPPGNYRLCVLCGWFDSLHITENQREYYRIYLTQGPEAPVRVLKRRVWLDRQRGWSEVQTQ